MSYRPGDPWGICDRCGFKVRLRKLRREHTGFRVCSECWDPKHPQELLRGRPDLQAVRDPRPEPADVFLTTNQITAEDL